MLRNSVSIGSCLVFPSSWLTWIASERTELFVDRSACEVPQFKFASRQMRRKKYLQMQIEPQQTSNEFPSPRLFRMHKAERLILRSLSNRNYHGNSSQTLPNLSSECIIPQLPAAPRLLPLKRNSVTADKRRDTFSGFRNETFKLWNLEKYRPGKLVSSGTMEDDRLRFLQIDIHFQPCDIHRYVRSINFSISFYVVC